MGREAGNACEGAIHSRAQNRKQPWVHGPPQESLLGMAWVVRLGTHARVRSTRERKTESNRGSMDPHRRVY